MYAANDDRLNGEYRVSGTRHYVYTRDLNHGNTFKNYKVGQSGMLPEYVAYIQITLREAKLANDNLSDCPLTRVYDQGTADAVLKFQQVYKARVKDGIVDSETKSLFAREVWKKMLQRDNTRYQAVVSRIKESNNKDCIKFIEHAATTVEIWELKNTDLTFQKISYTGNALGDPISDIIYVAVPGRYRTSSVKDVKIESINVYAGSFNGAPSYRGIAIEEIRGYAFDINTQTADYSKSQLIKGKTDYFTVFHGTDVGKTLAESGVFSIKLKGSLLGGVFGMAEGYAIDKISFVISYKEKISDKTTKKVPGQFIPGAFIPGEFIPGEYIPGEFIPGTTTIVGGGFRI
jgi:peptidoglycan hydrolase-like protein with peptidoglycan-binding domain